MVCNITCTAALTRNQNERCVGPNTVVSLSRLHREKLLLVYMEYIKSYIHNLLNVSTLNNSSARAGR